MPENNSERFVEMIRSANIFLSIFDLTILYDENDDIPYCSLMAISDGKGNVVGQLTGPSYDRETRRRFYSIEASTEAFPKIKARILSSKKKVSNEYCFFDRGIHYFYEVNYDVRTNNVIANHLSGSFTISDPISDIDPRETTVEREIDFNLKASQKPNELFSISSKNAKMVIRDEVYEENRYTGNRTIKMEYADGEIVLSIRKDGNSSLRYVNVDGECRATITVLDANTEPYMEVCCVEKDILKGMSEEEKARYHAEKLGEILEGKSYDRPFDNSRTTVEHIGIEDDERGNIMQLFNAVNTYALKIDMHEIPSKATTVMDYLGSDNCAPIHVFYSLMSVAFGFLNDEELTSLVGLNPRKLPDTPTIDSKFGTVILPQNKMFGMIKE